LAATNVPLDQLVREGRFRLDLYARLQTVTVSIPALRDRREKILSILNEIAKAEAVNLYLGADAAEAVLLSDWPTNVRGLQRLIHFVRNCTANRGVFDLQMLSACAPELVEHLRACRQRTQQQPLPTAEPCKILRHKSMLQRTLENHGGNISQAARELGTTRAQVYRWMKRLGLNRQATEGLHRSRARETPSALAGPRSHSA
jgi:sigma-54 dependent transcriptional regulator, acetoin dehydrogenase operon transcriptional activator AcoR